MHTHAWTHVLIHAYLSRTNRNSAHDSPDWVTAGAMNAPAAWTHNAMHANFMVLLVMM